MQNDHLLHYLYPNHVFSHFLSPLILIDLLHSNLSPSVYYLSDLF